MFTKFLIATINYEKMYSSPRWNIALDGKKFCYRKRTWLVPSLLQTQISGHRNDVICVACVCSQTRKTECVIYS